MSPEWLKFVTLEVGVTILEPSHALDVNALFTVTKIQVSTRANSDTMDQHSASNTLQGMGRQMSHV